jgi:CHAT domain-containing protein
MGCFRNVSLVMCLDSSMGRRNRRVLLLASCLAILCGVEQGSPASVPGASTLVEELTQRLNGVQGYGPRISVLSAYHSCPGSDRSPGVIPPNHCKATGLSDRSLRRLAAHISRNSGVNAEFDAAHAGALIEMLSFDDSATISTAISRLEAASRASTPTAPVLSDLAAAHLLRAQQHGTIYDLVAAIDASARALDLEPEYRPALFNLALGIHWFGLEREASTAWARFLSADSTSDWAEEARKYVDQLSTLHAPYIPDRPDLWNPQIVESNSKLVTFAAAAPAEAQNHGMSLLGSWGMSLLHGDLLRAVAFLEQATLIAQVLEQRSGDTMLADAVEAIRHHIGDPSALVTLADGYAGLSFAGELLAGGNYRVASRVLRRISSRDMGSGVLKQWSTLSLAATLVSQDSLDKAIAVLEQLEMVTDTILYPAVTGAIHMQRGSILMKKEFREEAIEAFTKAVRHFEHNGERLSIGFAYVALAKLQFRLGHADAAYESVHLALGDLRTSGRGTSDVLYLATQLAMGEGYSHAAVLIQNEGLKSIIGFGGRNEAVARLSRARALSASGKSEDAAMDAQRAGFFLDAFGSGEDRRSAEAEILLIDAESMLPVQPRWATVLADSILRITSATKYLSAALALRAEARLALGELDRADGDLRRAVKLAQQQRSGSDSVSERVGRISRGLVMGYVNAGRSLDALEVVEELRAEANRGVSGQSSSQLLFLKQFRDQTAIEYLFIGDTLLTWTIAGSEIHLARSTVSRQRLSNLIAATRIAMEFNQGDEVLLPYLQALYESLIKPVQTRIGGAGTSLVIVTDGEIGSVPFSALHDVQRGRYLLEDHPLRFARSLREASRTGRRAVANQASVLILSDPAFDSRTHPGLAALPAARVEADSVAMEYTNVTLLEGAAAQEHALETGLSRASILHFAGHAFYDGEHPAQSFLVLAPDRSSLGDGALFAAEIKSLDLRRLRLAVLAGCETLRTETEWPGQTQGLAGALLTAGAGGVIGSRWRVNDDLTQALMIRLHREYKVSGDGAGALREAQLAFLHSRDPPYRSPAAWAAFEYMGN